jgi:tetratricopeptide (TPR) repeat protein
MLVGQVLQTSLDLAQPSAINATNAPSIYNNDQHQRIALSWRLIDVGSAKPLGSHTLSIDLERTDKEYPDLLFVAPNPADRVILASARETWKSLAPYMEREETEIALPWLVPGSIQVRKGNAYARVGRWDLAEVEWREAARKHPWNSAAQLNYSIALAAKEEFPAAMERLGKVGPIGRRNHQAETLVWLDQRHRWYRTAHRLPAPEGGYAFPDPAAAAAAVKLATDVPGPDELPWWAQIPGVKPPGWTWRAWLTQPWLY